jgi:hypothetical protein
MHVTRRSSSPRRDRRRRSLLAAAPAVVIGLAVLGSCSSEDVAEQLTEQAIESSGGEGANVDVDSETGQVDIETEDGSMSFGTAELPDDWPSEIPLPDGYELTNAMVTGADGERSFIIGGTFDGDAMETFDSLTEQFAEDGWTEVTKTDMSSSDGVNASASFTNDTWQAILSVSELADAGTTFGYTIIPVENT